jgi:hypothetical protein
LSCGLHDTLTCIVSINFKSGVSYKCHKSYNGGKEFSLYAHQQPHIPKITILAENFRQARKENDWGARFHFQFCNIENMVICFRKREFNAIYTKEKEKHISPKNTLGSSRT